MATFYFVFTFDRSFPISRYDCVCISRCIHKLFIEFYQFKNHHLYLTPYFNYTPLNDSETQMQLELFVVYTEDDYARKILEIAQMQDIHYQLAETLYKELRVNTVARMDVIF